jgi:hypothetical protein
MVDGGQGPIHYTLHVTFDGTRADMPQVFIDGVEMQSFEGFYPNFATPIHHEIELRYADQVLARMPVGAAAGDCGGRPDTVWSSIDEYVGALVSGDLRYYDAEWRGDMAECVEDGTGVAHCECSASERCAPRIIRAQPLFTQMACTPIGPKRVGDPCTLTDDPDGAYDDCGENLVCSAGTCTWICSPDFSPEEYPPEVARCPLARYSTSPGSTVGVGSGSAESASPVRASRPNIHRS